MQAKLPNRYLNGPWHVGVILALWFGQAATVLLFGLWSVEHAVRSIVVALTDKSCQTLLCLDTSSQTWKHTGVYTENTQAHIWAQIHTHVQPQYWQSWSGQMERQQRAGRKWKLKSQCQDEQLELRDKQYMLLKYSTSILISGTVFLFTILH